MRNSPMSDDATIRLTNLTRLRLTAAQLKERLGRSSSFWSDLIRGQKSFGEKLARAIEEGLQLPRGWLDKIHDDSDASPLPAGDAAGAANADAAGTGRPTLESWIEALARTLNDLGDAERERVATALVTLTRAPDSLRARAALHAAMAGALPSEQAEAGHGLSAHALDLARQLDAIQDTQARRMAHRDASRAVSLYVAQQQVAQQQANKAPAPQVPPPAPRPGQRPHKRN